ncbi:MAG: hypothetical protein FWF53_09400 [Candidatus Azobacteroides sp.]|nr:hypothetical protein [Candidatus Azobacteroides sp.]
MESELNKKLVLTVLKHIPKNKKSVVYLSNTLNISRESAYRRMRGDIPFTIQELVILAADLEFSIDSIFDQEKQNRAFFDFTKMKKNTTDFFLLMVKKYSELVEKLNMVKKLEAIMAFNTFPPPFYADFPDLFRFTYYKWLHQDKETYRNTPYSEVVLPDEAVVFQRRMRGNLVQGSNVVIILDTDIFLNLIKEVQYFYHRKLISDEEIVMLKEDILQLIEKFEDIAQTGHHKSVKIQVYLSSLCINSNTAYYTDGDQVDPLFWIFTINPVVIQNTGFISMQLKWLNSLKRQSALITQSNEIMQAEFFFRQRDYIEKYLSVDSVP